LVALTLSFQVGGCSAIGSHWPFARELPPAPPAPARVHREFPPSSVNEEPAREERRKSRRSEVRKQPAAAAAMAPTPAQQVPAPAAGTTTVTLEDNDANHQRAQSLIEDADAQLAHIDPSKLSGENATAYEQASNLANAARKAMGQQDYLAASGLARKAAVLTTQLTAPSQR
jgi:hypothetical protein